MGAVDAADTVDGRSRELAPRWAAAHSVFDSRAPVRPRPDLAAKSRLSTAPTAPTAIQVFFGSRIPEPEPAG